MNRRTKYSAIIVAALFAAAPIAVKNSNVLADTVKPVQTQTDQNNKASQNDQKSNDQQQADTTKDDQANKANQSDQKNNSDQNTNTVKGNVNNKPSKADQITVTTDDGQKAVIQLTDNIKNAKKIEAYFDKNQPTKIKYRKDLTLYDALSYIESKENVLINGKTTENNGIGHNLENEKGKSINLDKGHENPLLKPGYKINIFLDVPSYNLEANTWYEWTQNHQLYTSTRKWSTEILDRTAEKKLAKGFLVAQKTDEKGNLPTSVIKKENNKHYAQVDGFDRNISSFVFTVSTDKDAVDVPKSDTTNNISTPSESKPQPTDPSDEIPDPNKDVEAPTTPNDSDDTLVLNPDDTSNDENISDLTDQKADQNKTTENKDNSENKEETQKPSKPTKVVTNLMFDHNAYVYNRKGKLVKRHGLFILKRKYQNLKVLDKGRVYTIKGKRFYRIGKNQFIKVANTTKRPKAYVFKRSGKVNSHFKSIRVYDNNGKYIKKHIKSRKALKFDQKRMIKGHLFYRISGTKNWVRANKIKVNK